MRKLNLFATPIFLSELTENHFSKVDLLTECYAWKSETEGLQVSNVNGWHSPTTLFRRETPEIKRFSKAILQQVEIATASISPDFQNQGLSWKSQGWININSKFSFNAPHDHPNFTWSGVYYLKVPKLNDEKFKKQGCLEFLDPRNNAASSAGPLKEMRELYASNVTIEPHDGMLVIFPSFLMHWVYPNETEEDRVSIAFNLRLE